MARYTFGDGDPAAARLARVAAAYEPVSRRLLAGLGRQGGRVLDLGCGPGFSTALLAEVLRPDELVGLDASADFVARATGATFAVHDVTQVLPGPPADVLYARLVLAHLPDPLGVAEAWRSQLAPGGVLVVEDLERIDAPPGPLRAYDELSAARVAGGGGPMYAGPLLAPLGGEVVPVTVPGPEAAAIYRYNLDLWGEDVPGLDAVVDGEVTWWVRQLVLGGTK